MTEPSHNGWLIQLKSSQRPDGTWGCAYAIKETELPRSSSVMRNDTGRFSTCEEAEAAALKAAQAEINSRGPIA